MTGSAAEQKSGRRTTRNVGDRVREVGVARMILVISGMLLAGVVVVAAACGGSASESPWPVEPDHLVVGPEGEEGRPPPRKERQDGGTGVDAGPNVEP
jgi:hypothetical protein